MKKIAEILILFILIIIFLILLLKIPFDSNFIANLLNGLLTNLVILIIAIFVIDNLTKKIETKKLKDINERNSNFVSLRVNIFVFKILEYLKVLNKKDINTKEIFKKNEELTFDYVWQELEQTLSTKNINQILSDSTFEEIDKKQYLTNFVDLIKSNSNSLHEALKIIYPHPSPNVVSLVDEIGGQSGAIYAMSLMANVDTEVNKLIPESSKKMDRETADALLKFAMMLVVDKDRPMSIIISCLKSISEKAKNNDLFID